MRNQSIRKAILIGYSFLLGLTFPLSAQQWRIMAVGNSITAGKDGITGVEGNGFRKYLYDDLRAAGVDFALVGGRGNSPYNGHFVSGAKIDWFLPGGSMDIKNALDAYQPNIVLVHLGTNNTSDTPGPYTQDYTAAGKLRKLVNDQIAKDPNVKHILLCKIIPKLDANFQEIAQIRQFNREIELMFFNNALSSKVVIVDMYSAINPTRNDLPDGIHPIDAGYQKMALEYSRVIKALIRSDSSAPNPVDVISSAVSSEPAVVLEWYTPSDQGGGIVNMYEVRYLIDQEISAANFENGQVVYMNRPGRNNYSGGREQRRITENILAGRTYYFGIRVYDQANNRSTVRRFDPVTIPAQLAQPGIEFVDEFTSPDLKGWNAAPSYAAVNGVLKNTDAASAWKNLAILSSIKYTPSAEYVKAGVRFATTAAYTDLSGTGIAMLLDSDDYRIASGYMIRVRDDISLYTIVNGQVLGNAINSTKPTSKPAKGDTLYVVYRNNPSANSFEVLKNGVTIGTVQDTQKRYGKAAQLYSGVILYGSLGNEIDSYFLNIPQLEPRMMAVYGEPPLFGEVDKKMGAPLSVRVLDINGVGVANVPVDFRVKSGVPAFLSADSVCQSFDGYIYIEAESGIIEAPMIRAFDQNASNGRYIYSRTFGSGKAIYAIWVPCTGSYDMILRVIAPDDNSNSVFWAIDDTTVFNRIDFPDKPTVWTWASRNRVSGIPLSEGFHKLYIKGREPNLRIDKILLTRYSGFTPQGQGGTPPRFANITDERGIVSTNVTFGNQAGQVVIEAYSDGVPSGSNLVEFPAITVNAGTPNTFTAASSLVIQGEAGRLLPEPFKVKVTDRYGNNRRGELVIFQVQQGSGTFNGMATQKSFTDEFGIAEAVLKLGFENQTIVKAYLNDYPAFEPILFTGAAETGTVPFAVSNQTGADRFESAVNVRLPDSLRVRIVNQRGIPYRGYPVPFAITRGDGRLNDLYTSVIDSTDADGIAAVSWTIGRKAGVDSHQVQVRVPLNGSPIIFTATARPDPPNELQLISGNDQQQGAGKQFPEPLRVRIIDQYSNGIVNYRVRFTVVSGYGNFSNKLIGGSRDTTVVTNADGYAQVYYTAGNVAGNEQVKAEGAESTPLPLKNFRIFQLRVTPPLPQRLAIESGNNQTQTVGFPLSQPFAVKVLNPFGNAMGAGIRVLFQIKEGNSTFNNQQSLETTTDAAGIARATMTLGTIAGLHKAVVSLPDFADVAPIEFTATAQPAAAAVLKAVQPGNLRFSAQAGSGPIQLIVQVTDLYGNPRAGQAVAFTVENGAYFQTAGGFLKITQVTTDAKGQAAVNYVMGQQTGVINLIKAVALKPGGEHLAGSPLTFEGTVLPGPPVSMRRVKEYSQAIPVRRTYPDSLMIELKDIHQNPVPEIDVLFTVRNRFGGNINGLQQVNVSTNAYGRAGVLYTMGSRAGAFSDTVLVSVPGYSLQTERILLTALPDDPYKISIVGDSTWVVKLGAGANAKTPTVRVTDAFDNPIGGRPVTFTVVSGNSSINGAASYVTPTLPDGQASAPWLLKSTTPEQHLLSVSCEYNGSPLLNSPKLFRATVIAGDASRIVRVSPAVDRIDAVAKSAMTIVVSVQDAFGNGIANNPVKFSVTYPASGERGFFVRYGQAVTDYQTTSNAQGFAQAIFYPIIGTNIITIGGGDDQPIPKIALNINGIPARATRIRLLNPRQMEATAGDSIIVRVEAYNAEGALVDGHPIDFVVVGNSGHLSNRFSVNRKMTTNGFAQESWMVGTRVGVVNKLRVSGGEGIQGSPDSILVTLRPSAPFADSSSVRISAPEGITTDDDSKALVTVRVADRYGNPISGRRVRLTTESPFAILEQPTFETNTKGEAYGWLRATKVGIVAVGAALQDDPNFRIAAAQVRVKAGRAAKIAVPEGESDRFTVNVGAIVGRPLRVQVRDKYDNLVQRASAEVMFELQAGTGEFITPTGRVKTTSVLVDSNGIASVVYKAGNQVEICMIKAKLVNPTVAGAELSLIGMARAPLLPYSIRKVSGDSLRVPVGSLSPAPLMVQVLDAEGLPVWSGTAPSVQFKTISGQVEFSGGPLASSDEYGRAVKSFRLLAGGRHTIAAQVFGGEAFVLFTAAAQAGAPQQMAPAVPL
ncbi:MAG: GDSL-type esterase/lipase family protein, partial [candidate division KSB1 bacterium]|nr:GDSL-type esterase/lipase family protein [candidate division KSB1 bacterium]